jgi:hypothetical protein
MWICHKRHYPTISSYGEALVIFIERIKDYLLSKKLFISETFATKPNYKFKLASFLS